MKKDYGGITEKEIRRKFPGMPIVAGRSITSSITDEMFWQMQEYKEKQKEKIKRRINYKNRNIGLY